MIYKVAVPAVLALALAGCGDVGQRSAAAAEVAVRMLTAVDGKDGAAACATLAPDTASELAESAAFLAACAR